MKTNLFRHRIYFTLLSLIGLLSIPYLPFQLTPNTQIPSIELTYSWPNASAELIEREVTSVIEGGLASLAEVEKITSNTSRGQGQIEVSFSKNTDVRLRRFEASGIVKQLYPGFPKQLTYPQVEIKQSSNDRNPTLISYTLNGRASPQVLYKYAERRIKLTLSQVEGVSMVDIYGSTPQIWELSYNPDKLKQIGVSKQEIQEILIQSDHQVSLGRAKGSIIQFRSPALTWKNIPIKRSEDRTLLLSDLVDIRYVEPETQSYYRLNGLNTLNIRLEADPNINQLTVAKRVKESLANIEEQLPSDYSLILTYDSTEFLQKELQKIGYRSLFTCFVLFVFLFLISRSFRYLGVILFSLLANLLIACFCYYLLGIELHLYALAGITVSLGLLIDNSILMVDHIRNGAHGNVFMAILAATLTTLASLSIIFFLPEEFRLDLQDFSSVILINLAISLAISLWLIPALQAYLHPNRGKKTLQKKYIKRVIYWESTYEKCIHFSLKSRFFWISLIILAFGIPVFKLPAKWNIKKDSFYYGKERPSLPTRWYEEWYDATIGSNTYQKDWKPWIDNILGGSLRLFIEETFPSSEYKDPQRTALYVEAKMDYGTTISQMNTTFQVLENYLSQFSEVEKYESSIYSSQEAYLTIYFHPQAEKDGFPYVLKSRLESQVLNLGAPDWNIYGVGRAFSNAIGFGNKNSRIGLKGYNYDKLQTYAEELKERLLAHPRIKEVFLNGEIRWDYRPNSEFVMRIKPEELALRGISPERLMNNLTPYSLEKSYLMETEIEGQFGAVYLSPTPNVKKDIWQVSHLPLGVDSLQTNLTDIARLEKFPAGNVILKEDQQYQIWVEYDFIGPSMLGRKVQKEMKEETQYLLPLGFSVSQDSWFAWWEEQNQLAYGMIFWVILMIFGICATLFESIKQPLAVIGMIPISFIGVFLTFYGFNLNFDQGGYAALLLLSGLSVNSAIYVTNDFNHFRKFISKGDASGITAYIKAFRHKIIPVMLTILSTMIGLTPFLLAGKSEPFWFALAAGTIGGLFSTLVGIWIYLPLFLLNKNS